MNASACSEIIGIGFGIGIDPRMPTEFDSDADSDPEHFEGRLIRMSSFEFRMSYSDGQNSVPIGLGAKLHATRGIVLSRRLVGSKSR
ncbi:hypothetical protein D3OALGA1CA_87 [Olavius algarvensis associated proteobacterium Delta 3]|nr:hypothetical protein D3OALGA1CA_87 [Olavius algarvensis associated proteobacterium Delta 3]